MKKKTILKRILATAVLATIMVGAFPTVPEVEAYTLQRPQRVRPTLEDTFSPENIDNTFVTIGNGTSLFITDVNTVKSVGINHFSRGCGDIGVSSEFCHVVGSGGIGLLTDVVGIYAMEDIDSAPRHAAVAALKSDGTVWTWGRNRASRLGTGSSGSDTNIPVQVLGGETGEEFLSDIVALSVGYNTMLALRDDGTVWGWGSAAAGRLGAGHSGTQNVPVQVNASVPGFDDIVAIEAGNSMHFAIKADGTLWGWGNGYAGQIPGIENVASVTSGYIEAVILKEDGTVWQAQQGLVAPVQIKYSSSEASFLTDIVKVQSSLAANFYLHKDGTLLVGRSNTNFCIYTPNGSPISIGVNTIGVSDVVAFSAYTGRVSSTPSNSSTIVITLKNDGSFWGWAESSNIADWGTAIASTTSAARAGVDIEFLGQPKMTTIPEHMLYHFNSPIERNLYEGNKHLLIEWELISDPVKSFDIYYAPGFGWEDESTWVLIESNVAELSLNPTSVTSSVSDGQGGYLSARRYQYNWMLPNEFIPHIRIIAIPQYH